MLLYIRAYQLTFQRVSVLVALAVIALLMAGVIAKIVKPQFPLFRYGFVLVGAVHLCIFSHVDYFIAISDAHLVGSVRGGDGGLQLSLHALDGCGAGN